jgi:hypothetical protein
MKTNFSNRLLFLLLTAPLAFAQPAKDPFIRGEAPPAGAAQQAPPSLSMTYEAYSLPLAEAAALLRKAPGDAGLHQDLVDRVAKNQAKQETLVMLRGLPGQRMVVESNSESIAPMAHDVGVAGTPGNPPQPATHAAPPVGTAFETMNCGIRLEMEPTLSMNQQIAHVKLIPDHTSLPRRVKWGQGISEIELPVYMTQKINTQATTAVGSPCFLGTISPPSPSPSKPEESSAKRIWFAFITVDLAK